MNDVVSLEQFRQLNRVHKHKVDWAVLRQDVQIHEEAWVVAYNLMGTLLPVVLGFLCILVLQHAEDNLSYIYIYI